MDEFKFQAIKTHISTLTDIKELKLEQQLYKLSYLERVSVSKAHAYEIMGVNFTKQDVIYYDTLYTLATTRLHELTSKLPKSPFPANSKPPHRR